MNHFRNLMVFLYLIQLSYELGRNIPVTRPLRYTPFSLGQLYNHAKTLAKHLNGTYSEPTFST